MRLTWDEPKRLSNLDKHGMDFAVLTQEFFDTATIYPTRGKRFLALGFFGRRRFHRGDLCTTRFGSHRGDFYASGKSEGKESLMNRKNLLKEFTPGRGYSKEDWDAVDSPELTDEQLAQGRPFAEVFPELAESIRRGRGRPPVKKPLQQISIRLDPDVVAKFKATGKGWQARVNDVLKRAKVG